MDAHEITEKRLKGLFRLIKDFKPLEKLGEGTFSEVLKVECLTDSKMYAMKRFKKQYKKHEVSASDEIAILKMLNPHPNIVKLYHIVYEPYDGVLCLTFELMQCNLYELLSKKGHKIPESVAKEYTQQIFVALDYIHGHGIFHRDVKPENILINGNQVKLADFGSCRPIKSQPPYTEYIATRWYRSPECILAEGIYDYKMDIWAVGCVLFEMLTKNPLFPGSDEFDQIRKIHEILGTPSDELLKKLFTDRGIKLKFKFEKIKGKGIPQLLKATRSCVDLINATLRYDPSARISASDALKHAFFQKTPVSTPVKNSLHRPLPNIHRQVHKLNIVPSNEYEFKTPVVAPLPQQLVPIENPNSLGYPLITKLSSTSNQAPIVSKYKHVPFNKYLTDIRQQHSYYQSARQKGHLYKIDKQFLPSLKTELKTTKPSVKVEKKITLPQITGHYLNLSPKMKRLEVKDELDRKK